MTHTIRWTVEKITQRLALIEPLVYRRHAALPPFRYLELPSPTTEPPISINVNVSTWQTLMPGAYWGKPVTDFVLRSVFEIPSDWDPTQSVALYLPLGDAYNFSHPETLAYIDGKPYAACDRHHQEIVLRPEWRDQRPHILALHGWTGLGGKWNTETTTHIIMHQCEVVQIDSPTRDFIALTRVALGAVRSIDVNTPAHGLILNALNAAFIALDTREPFGEKFYASVTPAYAALKDGLARAGAPLDVALTATGHAHIDVAWLWTLDQTRRKAGRTFHTVLRLMEQFPNYHFAQSQPQLYEYVRNDYPELFSAIKQRVAEGRWEAIGGMWIEADCNLSGAESLARQFLLGRTFFREHFGTEAESPVLWLPDVFGYAWALPQLIKQAGLHYFFTIKIGWNQYNRLPFDSFWWQGLDGTRVLTHFSTTPEKGTSRASTYNALADSESVMGTWKNFQPKEFENEVLMSFGYGDGGGGPTREMLENMRELESFPAMPRVRQRDVGDFFRDLEGNSGASLPVWNGELYLEYHRGTYTTQSRNKRANRKSEFLLHDAEFLASLATHLAPSYVYPTETFTAAWRLVCLNQFHDIIPGSSIGAVYVDSQKQYAQIREMAITASDTALAVIAQKFGGDVLIVNATSFTRSDLVFVPDESSSGFSRNGKALNTQQILGGIFIDVGELPPYSIIALERTSHLPSSPALRETPLTLENECLRVEFLETGDIKRIFDKTNQREVLPPNALSNQLMAFEDRPKDWDAWDIDIFYDDKVFYAEHADSIQLLENGPLRWTMEIKRRILNSSYTQRISLTRNSPRLDFDTSIDWREHHILLKTAFPIDVLTPVATYEIQWGNVQRPTHRNTSWDWARFETCAQKWVDLSEGDYGVSLLNDCKYGHDIQGNVIRLSLLRSPTFPDPEADQGEHNFTYSLLPHTAGWEKSTAAEAYALNDPLKIYRPLAGNKKPTVENFQPFIKSDSPNIIIETIKRAEDGRGVIVRFYESQRRRGDITLTTAFPLAAVYHTNLLEETQAELTPQGNQVTLFVKPYEIVTLRLIE